LANPQLRSFTETTAGDTTAHGPARNARGMARGAAPTSVPATMRPKAEGLTGLLTCEYKQLLI
jgi:hypothetical protein